MTAFTACFDAVVRVEGGFQADEADAGNWTGGACNRGVCNGTKWGISASSYPHLDIVNLTRDDAARIYRKDFWSRICGDDLPSAVAFLCFDAAVNCGVSRASHWLQAAVDAQQDGQIGPATVAACQKMVAAQGERAVLEELLAQRIVFMAGLTAWRTFGSGWARRLAWLPYESIALRTS